MPDITHLTDEELIAASVLATNRMNNEYMAITMSAAQLINLHGFLTLSLRHPDAWATEGASQIRDVLDDIEEFFKNEPALVELCRRGRNPKLEDTVYAQTPPNTRRA